MKAITYDSYGSADVLQLQDVRLPECGEKKILIRVRATEATKADVEMRSFKFSVLWFWLPMRIASGWSKPKRRILGAYFAGEVVAVGKGVTDFAIGDEIFGAAGLHLGAYAEYVALPAHYAMITKPSNMTFSEAAAAPLGGFNGLHFMQRAALQPGEKILIIGAGVSIGLHAVQIAKAMGAEVTAVDAGIKETLLRQLGADHFIDFQHQDFRQSVESFDVIFDMVPGSDYDACIRLLNPKGRYLSGNPRFSFMIRSVFSTRFTDKTVRFAFAAETRAQLQVLKDMIEAGTIKPIVDKVFPMAQVADAHRPVETEQRIGAIVIEMPERESESF